MESKQAAQSECKNYYYDANGKMRSTLTDEICIMANDCGMLKIQGVKTGRVYENITADKTKKDNLELKNNDKYFHYEYFPQWKMYGKICKLPVENETGKPFKLMWINGKHHLAYYNMESKISPFLSITDGRYLTDEEAKHYMP